MRSRFIPLVFFLAIAFVLVFVIDDFVQQVIVAPILRVAWFFTVVVTSVPQFVFWGVFIVIALIIAGKSLGRETTFRQPTERVPASQRGPTAAWLSLLERAKTQKFSRWRLAQAIRKLSWDIRSPSEPSNQLPVEENNEAVGLTLPADIEAYFNAPMPSYQRFPRFWQRHRVKGESGALSLDPERVVEYLEHELDPLLGDNR